MLGILVLPLSLLKQTDLSRVLDGRWRDLFPRSILLVVESEPIECNDIPWDDSLCLCLETTRFPSCMFSTEWLVLL